MVASALILCKTSSKHSMSMTGCTCQGCLSASAVFAEHGMAETFAFSFTKRSRHGDVVQLQKSSMKQYIILLVSTVEQHHS